MKTKIILDVDTGVDDAMAVLTAALSPETDLLACTTTWGNIDVDQAARNTAAVLQLAGRSDVPVSRGAAGPRDGSPAWYSHNVHGVDGQGGQADTSFVPELSGETAVETILRLTREHPGEIELVAVGPFTNIAAALDADPTLPERVRGVTVMGGAFLAPGNVTPVAEANVIHDPEAAQVMVDADWRVTFVGLDVTMTDMITEVQRERLAAGGEIGQYVARILDFYFDFYREVTGERCAGNHDALAVAVATGLVVPTLAPTVRMEIDDTHGPGRGQTIADLRPMTNGWKVLNGARHCAVLEIEPGFTDRMIDLLARS
ncbi:nucleoside hydrolase [Microbacterium amylolyticum]|uniref:Purine nucleosidase n=1 Tax=Microbacterium amylolyticum TaxID=936337 RepID=A0ABS4ZGD3_9MICO|nr:nucleoside hydrolase [Microbacterium amylolyticum]MBP2436348.1 purine nucleosidase [Microbacterium amylolyticum]